MTAIICKVSDSANPSDQSSPVSSPNNAAACQRPHHGVKTPRRLVAPT
eukprot:CAMPEP_0170300972 /NCGR_PEP_ID=MMETSP0116_2-20130129/50733_1 /TAXON_ID=400756 /ORGANISM="Durinskia baltica, Strain CSIRO CS-38" /LENGTH=47 /DNA_ID= /DNA_START= /DNA_END= /DNA_ORIENTATION=